MPKVLACTLAILVALGPSVVQAQSATEAPHTHPVVWPWAIVALGGAMLVASAVTGGLTLARQDELNRVCAPHSCPPSAEAAQAEGRALAFSTDALWVGGLVVGTAGVVLLLVLPPELEPPVTPTVACGPDGCFAAIGGSF